MPNNPPPTPLSDDQSTHLHRKFIGLAGALLPLLVVVIARVRPTKGLPQHIVLGSVSAYYYTGAVAVFVGTLAALSAFLLTYRGYANDGQGRDRAAGFIAGVAAALVALFPTRAPTADTTLAWWTRASGVVHFAAAVILFASFAYYSLVLFRRTSEPNPDALPPDKRLRNRIYVACGIAIIVSMLWALVASIAGASIFWAETAALESFAISWLTKGRIDQSPANVRTIARETVAAIRRTRSGRS